MRIDQSLTVKPDAVPAGETLRAWIPYPREIPASRTTSAWLAATPAMRSWRRHRRCSARPIWKPAVAGKPTRSRSATRSPRTAGGSGSMRTK
jgi:hypothetical protein